MDGLSFFGLVANLTRRSKEYHSILRGIDHAGKKFGR